MLVVPSQEQYLTGQLRRAVAQQMVDGFVEATHEMGRRSSKQLRALGAALSADAVPAGLRTRVHSDLGAAAQKATVAAYRKRPNRRNVGSYRVGEGRFAGGALERALCASDFYEATPNGVSIVNRARLDQEAKHWRRLNFGTQGGAGGNNPGTYRIELLNASLGLEPDRRPGFALPPGFWLKNGERVAPGQPGTAQFLPRGVKGSGALGARGRANSARFTRGIRATNFLDAGVKVLAQEMLPAYLTMYREFYYSEIGKQHFDRIQVKAPRPRTFRL